MSSEVIKFEAADGYALTGTHFPAERPVGAVVVAPATAVARRLYRKFALELASQRLAAFTFDYRGTGSSKPATLRGFSAAMHDWGELDLDAALRWMGERHPGLPLMVVGHSVGGQLVGMAPSCQRLAAMLFVGAQGGYWRHWSGRSRWTLFGVWHLLIPLVAHALGYLPMKRFGQGEDLPKGVALEWARWGRSREYFLGHVRSRGAEGYDQLQVPLRAYALADDWYAPLSAVEWLARTYRATRSEVRQVSPAELQQPSIGHFGVFDARFQPTLWKEMVDWLLAQTRGVQSVLPSAG